jgi:hypothetical protein
MREYKRPMFQQRHYEVIANTLPEEFRLINSTDRERELWHKIVDDLCRVFQEDNPKFNEAKFREVLRSNGNRKVNWTTKWS